MKLESKVGTITNSEEKIYTFLTNFKNFDHLIPQDKVSNWESAIDQCSFEIDGIGKTGMKIIEKEPNKLIKIGSLENSRFDFLLWIQLKQVSENETKVKLTLQPELNPMFQMMAKKPLQQFLDTLLDRMSEMKFNS